MQSSTYRPKPAINGHTHNPARPLKVYRSSVGDALTVALDVDDSGLYREGLRLDLAQVVALHAQLGEFIDEVNGR